MEKKFDVIILGAGTAGLSAAERLVRFKIENFLVLEARDRIGEWSFKNKILNECSRKNGKN